MYELQYVLNLEADIETLGLSEFPPSTLRAA